METVTGQSLVGMAVAWIMENVIVANVKVVDFMDDPGAWLAIFEAPFGDDVLAAAIRRIEELTA